MPTDRHHAIRAQISAHWVCPNPECLREWHGLPVPHVNKFWPYCPGSWAYEQERKADA